MLSTENISCHIGAKKILENVSLRFLPGCFNIILGPNGSGKSTFLNIISGELATREGTVHYSNKNINSFKKSTLSRYRAVMSQQPELHFPLLVEEVIMMGRYPHFEFNPGKKDFSICREVIELMNLQPFTERNYLTLSGGEKQRVHFARVLAQVWEKPADGSTRYLLLDEPLNNLDISYQQEFLQAAASFVKERAVMSQQPELHFPLLVEEVIMMGRYPHFEFNPGKKDFSICREVNIVQYSHQYHPFFYKRSSSL